MLGDGPLCQVLFTERPVIDYRTAFRADREKARKFVLGLFKNGIFLNPMGTKLYLSLAHTDEDIQKILEISRKVLKRGGARLRLIGIQSEAAILQFCH